MTITQDRLKELLHYCPITGAFTWISPNGRREDQRGQQAGTTTRAGYISITVDQRHYQAHRLAWLYMTGQWPPAFIDHQNRVKSDNRWENLRAASKAENNANKPVRTKSGLKGAYWSNSSRSWQAKMNRRYLGSFKTAEEAHAAYLAAAKEAFGEFASN